MTFEDVETVKMELPYLPVSSKVDPRLLILDTRIIGSREAPSRPNSAHASPVATPRDKNDFTVDFDAMD